MQSFFSAEAKKWKAFLYSLVESMTDKEEEQIILNILNLFIYYNCSKMLFNSIRRKDKDEDKAINSIKIYAQINKFSFP